MNVRLTATSYAEANSATVGQWGLHAPWRVIMTSHWVIEYQHGITESLQWHALPFTFHVAITMFWGWHLGICLCTLWIVYRQGVTGVTGVTWNWGSGRLYHDLSPCRPPWQRSWRPRFSMFLSSPGSRFKICMRNRNWKSQMFQIFIFHLFPCQKPSGDGVQSICRWWTSKSGRPMTRTCKGWRHRNLWKKLRYDFSKIDGKFLKIYAKCRGFIASHSMESKWSLYESDSYVHMLHFNFSHFRTSFAHRNARITGGHRGLAVGHCWHFGLWRVAPWPKKPPRFAHFAALQRSVCQKSCSNYAGTETLLWCCVEARRFGTSIATFQLLWPWCGWLFFPSRLRSALRKRGDVPQITMVQVKFLWKP